MAGIITTEKVIVDMWISRHGTKKKKTQKSRHTAAKPQHCNGGYHAKAWKGLQRRVKVWLIKELCGAQIHALSVLFSALC